MCFIISIVIYYLYLVPNAHSLERVVGGVNVSIEDFPYQLSLRRRNKHICGGALIASNYGLSAAHCFRLATLYSVKAGSQFKDSGGSVVNVKQVFLHPERQMYDYDIAVMSFQEPLSLSSSIQPVRLPQQNFNTLSTGMKGVISGFGDTYNLENKGSDVLRAAELIVIDSQFCKNQYRYYRISISNLEFCAGSLNGEKDSCQGDSGGPFVIDNVLYGLVSFGMDCGDPLYPGVYTNVAAFREFIRLNTGV